MHEPAETGLFWRAGKKAVEKPSQMPAAFLKKLPYRLNLIK